MYFICVMFNNPIYFSILTFELGLKSDIKLSLCLWYYESYALLNIFTQLTKLYFKLPMSQNLPVYNIYLIDPSNHHILIYTKLLAALGLYFSSLPDARFPSHMSCLWTHCLSYIYREFEQVLLKKLTWLQNSAVILKYPAECSSEEIKSQIEHLEVHTCV